MMKRRSTPGRGSSASCGRPSGCLVRARRSRRRQTSWKSASRPSTVGVTSNGRMKADDAEWMRELQRENCQLKAIVADQALDEPGITRCQTPPLHRHRVKSKLDPLPVGGLRNARQPDVRLSLLLPRARGTLRSRTDRAEGFCLCRFAAHAVDLHAGRDLHSSCDATPPRLAKRRGLRG
jgi:hypothetical protein